MSIIYQPKGRAQEYSLLALNHYTGCAHECEYCYVPAVLRMDRADFHKNVAPRKDVIKQVKKEAAKLACTDRRVLLSFTTDPYQPIDDDLKLTRRVLEILRMRCIPFQILTKGGMRAARDFDLYNKYDAFATTMTFLDPEDSAQWEPNAAPPADRIEAIKEAHEKGIQTWVSLEPVIDPAQSICIIESTHDIVDHYKIGTLNHAEPPQSIDLHSFGKEAVGLCEKYGKTYYIKNDLAKYLEGVKFRNEGVKFHNTDTRIVV